MHGEGPASSLSGARRAAVTCSPRRHSIALSEVERAGSQRAFERKARVNVVSSQKHWGGRYCRHKKFAAHSSFALFIYLNDAPPHFRAALLSVPNHMPPRNYCDSEDANEGRYVGRQCRVNTKNFIVHIENCQRGQRPQIDHRYSN